MIIGHKARPGQQWCGLAVDLVLELPPSPRAATATMNITLSSSSTPDASTEVTLRGAAEAYADLYGLDKGGVYDELLLQFGARSRNFVKSRAHLLSEEGFPYCPL